MAKPKANNKTGNTSKQASKNNPAKGKNAQVPKNAVKNIQQVPKTTPSAPRAVLATQKTPSDPGSTSRVEQGSYNWDYFLSFNPINFISTVWSHIPQIRSVRTAPLPSVLEETKSNQVIDDSSKNTEKKVIEVPSALNLVADPEATVEVMPTTEQKQPTETARRKAKKAAKLAKKENQKTTPVSEATPNEAPVAPIETPTASSDLTSPPPPPSADPSTPSVPPTKEEDTPLASTPINEASVPDKTAQTLVPPAKAPSDLNKGSSIELANLDFSLEKTLTDLEAMEIDSPTESKPKPTVPSNLQNVYTKQLTQLNVGFAKLKVQFTEYAKNKPENDPKISALRNLMQKINTHLNDAKDNKETQDTAQIFIQLESAAKAARKQLTEHRNIVKGLLAAIVNTLGEILNSIQHLIGMQPTNTINGRSEKWVVRTFFDRRTTTSQYVDEFRKCVHDTFNQSLNDVEQRDEESLTSPVISPVLN